MIRAIVILCALAGGRAGAPQDPFEQVRAHIEKKLQMLGAPSAWSSPASKQMTDRIKADDVNSHRLEDWSEEHKTFRNARGVMVTNSTYTSPAFKLKSGAAHFTLNPLYHVPMPKGDYAIVNQIWSIVDSKGEKVPLTEMYNHHWLIGTTTSTDPLEMCEGDFFWGGGAEFRNMDYTIPEGYGILRTGAKGSCGGNLHFIRDGDLKTEWKGMNDPKGHVGAARANCCECGYAPGRAPECLEWLDGSFACCFTGSRCPVNDPRNNTVLAFHMKYTIQWTPEMNSVKPLQIHVLDVSGGGHDTPGGASVMGIEWNVAPNLNSIADNQQCNDTVCNITNTWVVGRQSGFQNGICSGTMVWSYMHQHTGAISGHMFINGTEYCRSEPHIGTDPTNPSGNEQGFAVKFSQCVDNRTLGNAVRLNFGDRVTVTGLYDVDPASKRNFPLETPGGKHGGIMGLFFALMHCDAGTFGEKYVCRSSQCIPVPKEKGDYSTLSECEQACPSAGNYLEDSEAKASRLGKTELQTGMSTLPTSFNDQEETRLAKVVKGASPQFGKLSVSWRDCGDSQTLTKVNGLNVDTLRLGSISTLEGSGVLAKAVDGGNFTIKMVAGIAGLTLVDTSGDMCQKQHPVGTLLSLIHISWKHVECPMNAGNQSWQVRLRLNELIPSEIAQTTTTILARSTLGEKIFCMEVFTDKYRAGDAPDVLV